MTLRNHAGTLLARVGGTRPGWLAEVAASDSVCGDNEHNQLGAYYDGSDFWTGCPDESSWMQALPDSTRISQLTLPGTHDTGTFGLGSGYADADTQTLDLTDQLNAGIRVFDVRLKDAQCAGFSCLELYHGSDATGIYFNLGASSPADSFMMTLSGWMNQHPSEAIVMNIQDEDSGGTKNFAQQVDSVLTSHYDNQVYWGADGPNPTVGELRGKIYIMTQQGTAGGDYTSPPNPPSGLIWPGSASHNSGPPFVQDNYDCPKNKWSDIKTQLQWTAAGDPYQQYAGGTSFPNNFHQDININFTSAECDPAEAPASYAGGFFRAGGVSFGCTQPIDQKIGCNMFTMQYLQQNATGPNSVPYRYGIIYSDFPGPCLIDAEISQNPGVSRVAPNCSAD